MKRLMGGILALGLSLQALAHGGMAELSVYDRTEARRLPAQVLSLYYDSRANLAARGVLREPVPVAPLPRPFPGFVPDPRG